MSLKNAKEFAHALIDLMRRLRDTLASLYPAGEVSDVFNGEPSLGHTSMEVTPGTRRVTVVSGLGSRQGGPRRGSIHHKSKSLV